MTQAATHLVLRGLARVIPYRARPGDPALSLEELAPRYRRWETASTVILLGLAVPLTIGLAILLPGLAAVVAPPPAGRSVMTPGIEFWLAPSLFGSLLLSGLITWGLLVLALRKRYREYYRYFGLRHGYDPNRGAAVVLIPVGIGVVISTLLAFDCYTVVSEDRIMINSYLGFGERQYAVDRVQSIEHHRTYHAPSGKLVTDKPYYKVTFDDGYIWSARYSPVAGSFQQQDEMAKFLSERSGTAIMTLDAP